MAWYGIVRYSMELYVVVWYDTVWYGIVQFGMVWYVTLQQYYFF